MIFIIIVIVVLLVLVVCYNSLVRKRNAIKNAFGSIDAILKQRYDLIPNMVATVKQYSAHEAQTLQNITAQRTGAYSSMNEGEKLEFDRQFASGTRSFFALAENYPELKASENFMHLQRTLNHMEEQLSASRRAYNAAVTDYNNAIQTIPTSFVASMFGFSQGSVLETSEAERVNPNVKDLFKD